MADGPYLPVSVGPLHQRRSTLLGHQTSYAFVAELQTKGLPKKAKGRLKNIWMAETSNIGAAGASATSFLEAYGIVEVRHGYAGLPLKDRQTWPATFSIGFPA